MTTVNRTIVSALSRKELIGVDIINLSVTGLYRIFICIENYASAFGIIDIHIGLADDDVGYVVVFCPYCFIKLFMCGKQVRSIRRGSRGNMIPTS